MAAGDELHRSLDVLFAIYRLQYPSEQKEWVGVSELAEWWSDEERSKATRATLKCQGMIDRGDFRSCEHFELPNGEVLEVRFAPRYCEQRWDVLLWEANPQTVGQRIGQSFAADELADCIADVQEYYVHGNRLCHLG